MKLESYLAVITGQATTTAVGTGPAPQAIQVSVAGRTRPTLPYAPGRLPSGSAKKAHPTSRDDRGLRRENENALLLARNGYDVIQDPSGRPNDTNPDYLITGNYWDCYAPDKSTNAGQIRKVPSRKVRKG